MNIYEDNMNFENLVKETFNCDRLKDPFHLADTNINDLASKDNKKRMLDLKFAVAICSKKLCVDLESLEYNEDLHNKYSLELNNIAYKLLLDDISYKEIHKVINFCLDFLAERKKI
ncbi:MAG: hypothetical protein A2355_15225 [Spirochaetes bacterium RIFOXYB1_FULL_32_8]|nr:MAG: hypothetical protein A2Y30_10085 [Spirochaetes bacterium GWE1_32_154]OHD52160.1 MAG: hypothetical protein A2Y29_16955 [Spirochaetes bacterium GWE2_31_10]OHD78912.1 MAG: hypothetical protein A2355_15225 [Spirochaetes bacterium RIFOXYB1_FULL_32_8]HBD93208.1 hypothetical protein [Spirochaetia bacterium]HBI39321.1 hypothetical protein [Spirochaetia bacterium]